MHPRKYFRAMKHLTNGGIYALVNDRHKWVYIAYSTNLLKSIAVCLEDVKNNVHSIRKLNEHQKFLKLVILEMVNDKIEMLLRVEHYHKFYKEQGYKLYRYKKAIEFQVRIDVEKDFAEGSDNLLVYVNLYTKRKNKCTVGVFNTMDEANKFVDDTYRKMDQIVPVYSDNDLTKEYLEYAKQQRNKTPAA